MKSYVSSFSGSWFQRCLSMLLCFCMMLSLCPLPQHAAASEVEEGQEVSQPVETQPAPQPVETQPAPQPVETQPAPQPVETQPAPQPVETQPVTQPEETQPVTQPEETQPVTQPEETQPVTQPEETQPVTQPEETQEVTQPVETQEVTEPEETQEVTEPEETQETTEPEETQEEQPLVVTAWQWNDEWEALDEETGILGVSFASIENPVYLWSILEVLPAEIFATVDGEVVTLTLGEWKCDDYPTAGAYQGEYVFKTTLPEGYVLAEDAAALEVPVVFYSDASTLEEEHTHSFDASGVCSCGAMQVRYLDASHAVQTAVCQAVTAETTELTDGWYVAQGNVTIGGSVTATENANLILADGCSLTVGGDFLIQGGKSLNIYVQSGGTGSLTISGSTGLDISGSGDVSVGIYGGRIVVNASIGSEEWRMTLSSSAGSSAVIYCGGFGGNVDYYNGFCGVIVVQEYQEIWVYDSCTLCFDIVVPQGSKYMEVDEAFLTFTNGAKLQVPEGSSLRLYGLGSFPNGIAANVDLRTILDDYCAFQDSSGSIIKLSGETSLPGPITLVDKHKCSWQYKDSTAEGHTRYCDECGRSFIEPHRGDMEQGMEKTDINHTYTCGCGAEVTEAHTWEYWYDGADSHTKYCTGCGYSVEGFPHDYSSGACVCGAVQVSYSDATGTQQGTAVCIPLNSLDEEELNDSGLYEGWYLIEGNTVLDSLHNFNDVNLVLANGCCLQISSYHNAGRSVTIWQQPAEEGKATGKLVISGSNYAIYGSGVTIKGGVLELSGIDKAFQSIPTLGSCMKLSTKDENGNFVPVNFADRTSTLSSATELKLEPCTVHAWGGTDDNEYIDSSYHGVRCQYCGIGGDRKEAHSFDADGFCSCGAVQFLDASGNQAVQYCQVLSAEASYTDDISSGWYVVKGHFDFQGTMSGTVNLVLANGSKLYNSGDAWDHKIELDENANLTVYAQSTDPSVMGKLVSTYTSQYGLRASSITINGGNIYVEGMDWAVSGRFAVNGGIVELRATNDIGDVSYGMPSVPVGMRITIVKDEGNVPVTDREGDWSKQQHVIIQPCTDHSVTKGDKYQDDTCHSLVCAYCDVSVEGLDYHDFGTNGVCNCGLVQYLDENGVTKTQLCQKFTGGMENGGWYVLDKDYSRGGFWTEKDANLILAKGVTLNSDVTLYGCTLTVYGQPGSVLNLGNLDTEGGSLSILGGVTQIGTVNNYQPVTLNVNGGILRVNRIEYDDVTVNNQRGIYLESGVGQVAGDFTLSQSFELYEDEILTIPEGAKLTTGGKLVNNGAVFVDGELTDWYICTGEIYYPVKLPEGVTAQIKTDEGTMEDLRENDGKLYAKAEQEIVLTNNGEGTILVNENIYENSFFMPSRTVTVKTHLFDSDGFCTECGAYQPATKNNGKYEIGNAGQLFWFAGVVNGTLDWSIWDTQEEGVLTADIVIPDGKTWTPIGSNQIRYQGTFDGRYHKISNLRIEAPEGFSIGLFGASTGTIKCLTVENVSCGSVSGNYVGGICGMNYGTIRSCFADSVAWTNVGNTHVGSVCGYNGRAMGRIMDCRSANSTMQKTAASAAEELPLCGYNANSISGCTSDSGICLISDDGTISDCLSSGSYLCQNLRDGTIKDCYTTGSAFVLSKEGGTIDNCYYQAASETFNDNGSVGKTTAQFASGEVAYLLNDGRTVDGNPVWGQTLTGENPQAYPVLGGDQVAAVTKCDGTDEVVGYYNGTSPTVDDHDFTDNDGFCDVCDGYEKPNQDASGVYEIDNAGKLFWFADFCNNNDAPRSARLLNSIEIPKKADGSTRQWTPIGTYGLPYTGSFDGQGYTISGLYFNDSNADYVGLFGCSNGIIQNVTVAGEFTGHYNVGGICGYLKSGTIRNCQNLARVKAVQAPGGICGKSEGTIEFCHNSGTITASADKRSNAMAGGICGYLWCGATIGYCSNSGTVTGAGMCIGGIAGSAGSNWTDQLKDCWNSGSIGESDTRWVGGIIGGQYSSSGTVKNCYSYGTVSAASYGGPICSYSYSTPTNCFYQSNTETDSFGGTTAKTAEEFASGEVAYLLNAGRTVDGKAVWGQNLAEGSADAYPVLNGKPVAATKKCDGTAISYQNGGSDVTLPHMVDETGKCSICNTQFEASATINGETSYYETFLEASTQVYLSGNGTLTLLAEEVNTAVPSGSLIISGTFNLDLNGKTLNVNTSVYVENSEVQNGEAELNVLGGAGSKLILAEGEKLYVESGKANIQSGEITGDIMANGGALTITGGSFKGKIEVYNSATYSITGGEFVNLSNVPGSASSNMRLYQLPAEGYWFYSTRNVDEEGNYTYSNPVQYSDAESLEYRYNGSLYVGRHSHEIVFTSIDKLDHNGSCQGCGKTYFDHHSGLDDGFCDICGAGEISYVDAQGNSHNEMCFPVTEDTTELTAGVLSWYVVKDAGLLVENRITVNGSVNLILMDEKDLTVNGGIEVDKNKSLTIWGQTNGSGSLTCQNCNFDAGIGGTKNGACGSVTINGGNITTTGGGNSAGIGGSGDDGRGYVTGTIQINGGTVNATGGSFAPGIGGGRGRSAGTIVIKGGFVTATGKDGAPGIGGGLKSGYSNASQDGDGGNVTISNATVIANGIGGPGGNGSLSISNNSVVISDYIKDQTQIGSWNGVVFIKDETKVYAGKVYGNVTLSSNLTIPSGKTMTLDMNGNSLTLDGSAVISLGENSSLKLSGNGSFPNSVSILGGYLLDILADGWAFFYDIEGNDIVSLSSDTRFIVDDPSEPTVYLRSHVHSWVITGFDQYSHAKTCTCMTGSVEENHTEGDFCDICGAGMVSYVDAKDNDMGQQLCIPVTNASTELGKAGEETWYVVKDNLEASYRIKLSGDVNLILADGCLLNATKGIHVPEGSSLTIWCQSGKTGALAATGADGAGIGGNENNYKPDVDSTTGSITINGGNITAYGGWGDAAIGGGYNGSSGSVTINGGSVNAFGGGPAAETNRWGGAGIGGGLYCGAGTIQINGGTVYAVGAEAAAGIGGGGGGYGGSVEITGGHVTAIGGSENTSYSFGLNGIGSGGSDDIPVTIKGGTVICVAGNTTEGYAGKAYKSAPTIDSGYGSYKVTVAGTLEGLADGSPVDCASRTGAFTGNAAVKLEPCKSHSRSCEDKEDGIQHVHLCQYCGKVEGTEKHTAPDENGMCPDCGVKILAAVEEDGGSTGYYSDFLAAFDAANGLEDSTLKLLADVYAKNMLEVSGSFTLDLNGKTLTSDYFEYGDQDGAIWDDNGAICVPYDCSLTIQDSSEDKTGKIFLEPNPDLDDDHKNALAVKGGTLNFSGGSVNYRIRNEMGTLNISGSAKVEVGKDDTAVINVQPYYPTQKSRTVISGGTLIGGTCINAEGDTEVEITGGTFKALAGNSDDYSSCVNCVAGGSVTVSGGTFMKEQGDNVYTFMGNNISVSGGEFSGGISVVSGNLKDRLATDENGEIAYWYYQKLEDGVYSDGITAADAAAASYGSTVYVGCHEHDYVSYGNGTCVCGKQIPVAVSIGGETQFFDSLSAAMASLDTSAEEKAQVTVFQSTSFQNDLVIPENVTLTVKDGATLTAENNARLFVRSSLSGSVSGDVRYLVSVNTNEVNVTGRSVTVYLGSVYARADDPINLKAINYDADSMMLTDWLVDNVSSSESFTMPSHPVTIERKLEAIVATVTIQGETTPYPNLYEAFDAVNDADDKVIIELKADAKLDHGTIRLDNRYCNVIFSGGSYKIYGEEPGDWEHRSGYIGVLSGADLTIESGTIASSAFLHCGSGSSVTVTNGSIDTLIVEGGKLTVEPAVDEENNPVGNIRVENLEVRGFSVGDVQLKGGSYGTITVPGGKYVSDLLSDGYAYKLTDGTWEDDWNGSYTEAIAEATVVPVPVTITSQPDATKTMTYGDVESLSVTANREEASYQWYEVIPDPSETPQTKAITGETGSTLKLSTFNAGTHEFFCEATVDGYKAVSKTATVKVDPRTLDIQWDGNTFQYDGQYHPKFTIGNTANGDQVFPVLQSGNEPQKNVGSYTVIVTNFVANGTDGFNKHGNYKLGGTTYQDFSITAKPITVNITAIGGTYGGAITGATAELVGVVAGETVPVTLTYTSASGYNSTTVPTDAGTYKIKASINNGNYELTGVKEAEFVVNKATNGWTTEPSVANWTYGDANTVQPGAAKYGTVKVEYKVKDADDSTYIATAPTKAGSYKVRFTVEETSNYTGLSEEIAFTIGRRNLHIIFADNDSKGRVYNGTDKVELYNFTFEEGDVVSGDTVGIDMGDNGLIGTLSSKNVGTYTQVTLPNDLSLTDNGDGSAKNYNLVQPTGPVATNLTISPKKVTFSGITPYDKDYDGTKDVTNLEYSGLQISGLIDGDDLSVSVTAAFTDANAGQNKTVAFTNPVLTGNSAGNYVLKETGNQTSTTATIYPLEISIVDVTVDDKVYDGTKDATITNIGRLSTNYDGDKLTIVPGTASFETANAGNGKTVSFQGFELSGSAKDNYKLIGQPAPTTANITPATVAALTLKASSTTYDGNAKVPVIVAVTSENDLTLTGSDYQVSYQDADGNTVTELKNAGTYTVTVTGNGNFQGTATADFTIDRANAASTTAPKANSLTYNGQAQALVTAGTTTDGTMVYSTSEDGEYTTTIPTGTNAGGYEVWYMVQGDSNHLSTAPVKLTPTIAQKSVAGATITLGDQLTYNGEEQTQSITSVEVDGLTVPADSYEVSGNTGTNAKSYKLTITANGNFTGSMAKDWSIAKKSIADAEITLGDALTYNGKLQTQSIDSVKVGGLEVTYTVSKNTGTNAGEYTLTVTANGNFIGTKDMAWTIAKKSIADAEITLGAQLTYNGNPQRQSITSVKIDGLNVTYDASGVENTNAGSYTLTVTGNGNFQGTATASYTIAKAKPTVTPATLTITYGTKLSGCDLSGFKASFGGKELPGSFAFDQPDTMPHVSDSGVTSYKLTFTPDDTVNFEKVPLETKVTVNKKELTVNVAVQDKQYNGTSEAFFVDGTPTLVGVVTGDKVELTYGDPYFTDVAENKDIAISFTEAFGITGDDSGNYYLTQPTGITASIYNSFTAVKGEDGSYTVSTNEWTNQDFVVTAQEGFQLSLTNTADGSWSDTLTVTTEGEDNLKFYVRSADGAISKQASEHYKLDKTAPTGSISFDGTDQTAGTTPVVLYRNAAVNAEITGNDDRSGVKDLAWAAFKQAQEPSSITDWNTAASFQLTPEDGTERHVYLKVVDNAGNVAYFRANTILFDTTKPSITGVDGVEKGTTYYTTQTAAVSDDYLNAVTLNGAAVTLNEDGKTASVKLMGNVDKTYSIKATDKAGNESTVTVIMKPISAITDPFKNLTGENITEDDWKSLEDTKDILEDLLKTTTDENEKQKLQDELDKLQKLLDVLDKVKDVEELLRDLPDDVEPDVDADTEQQIKDARKALDDLTDHQEDLVEDDLIEKLERLEDELVDYKFLEGDGSTWNRGSGKAARFVGNGRLDKLDKVILDGTELTTGFTKNTPKTTIDLQAAFLQSLELGEHTLKLVYTDGEAEAKFTVKQSPNYLDLTGNPDFDDQTEVDVGGERYPIEEIGGRYVNLPESGDLLTTYTYLAGNAAGTHDNYPIGMRVFRINRSEDGTTVTEITEFADLLQYSGCSIRVSGKRGIRMITSMTKANKAALKGKGLAGFTMLEYGTVVQWADTLGSEDLTLNSGNHNYAYKRGVADPVFGTSGGLTQYTNVLVGFDLEECSKDIVMRPYIILQDAEGNQYTLYGGLVTRSISYIAWQNRDTYKPGTAAYKYVHELMGDLDTPAEGG